MLTRKIKMLEKDPSTYSYITYAWVFLVAIWGGSVNYLRKRREGIIPVFSITEFAGELMTSAFAGLITFFLCEAAQFNPMLSAALIAISGHMGSRAIFMLEKYLQKRVPGNTDKK